MRNIICKLCGNKIDSSICPYCETSNNTEYYSNTIKKIITVSLKENMPTVKEAKRKVDQTLSHAKRNGVRILKFINGYGSTGIGGSIRVSLRQKLQDMRFGTIIKGEDFSTTNSNVVVLLKPFQD